MLPTSEKPSQKNYLALEPGASREMGVDRKIPLFSLGGCVTKILCERFHSVATHEHLWRVTVPTLMSPPLKGRNVYESDTYAVTERLNFEVTKQARSRLEKYKHGIVIIDPTSDFSNDFFLKDGCVIPDIGCGLFGDTQFWRWPEKFPLHEWERISPRSMQYISMYVRYFGELLTIVKSNFSEIVVINRKLCANTVTADGLSVLNDTSASELNWWLGILWTSLLADFPDIHVLNLDDRLAFTSSDASYGEWCFHPVDEFYDHAVYKFSEMLRLGDKVVVDILYDGYLSRVHRRRIADKALSDLRLSATCLSGPDQAALGAEGTELPTALEEAEIERADLCVTLKKAVKECDRVRADRDALIEECTQLHSWAHTLSVERDKAIAERDGLKAAIATAAEEIAMLTAQVAEQAGGRSQMEQHIRSISGQRDGDAAERDEIKAALAVLTAERDARAGECAELHEWAHTLSVERDGLLDERDKLAAALVALQAERDAQAIECAELHGWAHALSLQRDAALAELDNSTAALEVLARERDRQAAECAELHSWAHTLSLQRDAALVERDNCTAALEVLARARDQQATECTELHGWAHTLALERDQRDATILALSRDLEAAVSERTYVEEQSSALVTERDMLLSTLEYSRQERASVEARLKEMSMHRIWGIGPMKRILLNRQEEV